VRRAVPNNLHQNPAHNLAIEEADTIQRARGDLQEQVRTTKELIRQSKELLRQVDELLDKSPLKP
jgi:hypothetical protein